MGTQWNLSMGPVNHSAREEVEGMGLGCWQLWHMAEERLWSQKKIS